MEITRRWLGVTLIILPLLVCITLYSLAKDEPRMIRIDCSSAEFNPNVPHEVRKACKDLTNAKWT